jgi:hypothetical protein
MTNIGSLKRGPENDACIFCRFSDRKSLSQQNQSVALAAAAMIERAPNTLSDVDLFSFSLLQSTMSAKSLSLSLPPSMLLRREKLMFSMGMLMRNCAPRSPMASSAGHCSISNNNLEMPRIMTKFTMRSPAGKREIHAHLLIHRRYFNKVSFYTGCAYCCAVTCGIK